MKTATKFWFLSLLLVLLAASAFGQTNTTTTSNLTARTTVAGGDAVIINWNSNGVIRTRQAALSNVVNSLSLVNTGHLVAAIRTNLASATNAGTISSNQFVRFNAVASRPSESMLPALGWFSYYYGGTTGTGPTSNQVWLAMKGFDAWGLRNAGYTLLQLDDGLFLSARSAGKLQHDPDKVPGTTLDVFRAWIKSRGYKMGLYAQWPSGNITASANKWYINHVGYEYADARQIAVEMQPDFLKFDVLPGAGSDDQKGEVYRYVLDQITRGVREQPGVLLKTSFGGLTNFGRFASFQPQLLNQICMGDVAAETANFSLPFPHNYYQSVLNFHDRAYQLRGIQGPGCIVDPDACQIAAWWTNSANYGMARTDIGLKAIMASPIILGPDFSVDGYPYYADMVQLLTNATMLRINQDPACIMGEVIQSNSLAPIYAKGLGSARGLDGWAVALNNRVTNSSTSFTLYFTNLLGVPAGKTFTVYDVWSQASLGDFSGSFTTNVPQHDTYLYLLTEPAAAVSASNATNLVSITSEGTLIMVSTNPPTAGAGSPMLIITNPPTTNVIVFGQQTNSPAGWAPTFVQFWKGLVPGDAAWQWAGIYGDANETGFGIPQVQTGAGEDNTRARRFVWRDWGQSGKWLMTLSTNGVLYADGSGLTNLPGGGSNAVIRGAGVTVSTNGGAYTVGIENFFDIRTYGATPNDGTDDSSAIQAAINAAAGGSSGTNHATSGTVYFPEGVWNVDNPLYLPPKNIRSTADFGNWSAITLTGPSHVSFTDGSTTGNQASTNGAYLLFGSFSTNSGSIAFGSPTNGWLRWSPRILNMTFAFPAQVGGTALCLTNMTGTIIDQIAVRTTNATVNVIQPWTNSVAIDLPNKDSGNEVLIGSVKISGFGDGIRIGEHSTIDFLNITACSNAVVFKDSNIPNNINRITVQGCQTGVNVSGSTAYFDIKMLYLERLNVSPSDFRSNKWDYVDSNTSGIGSIGIFAKDLANANRSTNYFISGGRNVRWTFPQRDPLGTLGMSTGTELWKRGPHYFYTSSGGEAGGYYALKSRGSAASPSAAQSGDYTFYGFGAHDGANWVDSSHIAGRLEANAASGNAPIGMAWYMGTNRTANKIQLYLSSVGNLVASNFVTFHNGYFQPTNPPAGWPAAPRYYGEAFWGNSNGTIYLLTSKTDALAWTATNKIAP